jgi:drug/metabolite transporter (DMT)-like permease
MDSSILLPVLFITLLWGTMPVLQKNLFDQHGKYNILFAANACYSIALLGYLYLKGWRFQDSTQMISKVSWTHFILFFGFVLCCMLWSNMMFANLIDSHKNAADLSFIVVVTSCYPIVSGLLSSWYFNEPISSSMWMGMILVGLGIALAARA